jgi:hypothetical protein
MGSTCDDHVAAKAAGDNAQEEEDVTTKWMLSAALAASLGFAATAQAQTTLTIATVNNPDMIVMQ